MVWLLNGKVVLTISNQTGVLPSINPNVTAEESSRRGSWVLVLKSTERHNQGQVACDLQGIGRKTASLFVQGVCVWDSEELCVCYLGSSYQGGNE